MANKKVIYTDVNGFESVVIEVSRQKDILDILDEEIENAKQYGWGYIFSDANFYIEYKDGSTYEAGVFMDEGTYRKKNIKRIIYINPYDTQVYGDYEVNEWGNVQ